MTRAAIVSGALAAAAVGVAVYYRFTQYASAVCREGARPPVWGEALISGGITVLGIFAVLYAVAYALRRNVVVPVRELTAAAARIAKGQWADVHHTFADDDIGALANAIQELAHEYERAKIFYAEKAQAQAAALAEHARAAEEKRNALEETGRALADTLDDLRDEREVLRRERDKLDVTLRGIGDGVFVIDRFEVVTFFNSAAEGLTGYASGEAIGRPYQEMLRFAREGDDKPELGFIDEVLSNEHALRVRSTEPLFLMRKNGTRIAVAANAAPLRDERGETIGVVVVFRDVGREREIDRAKTEFISLATHQLRTPVTTMKWIPEMLLEGAAGKLAPKQRKYIDDLRRSAERLVQLINKLLAIARIESGRIETVVEEVNMHELFAGLRRDFIRETENRRQLLIVHAPKVATLRTDPRIVGEILRNLLANAVKYTPEGGRIEIAALPAPHARVVFTVKDTGIGIPKAQQPRIFGKFFRADNAAKTEVTGTGLGLYVVKKFVEILGGVISFVSAEHRGTAFRVVLPIGGPPIEVPPAQHTGI